MADFDFTFTGLSHGWRRERYLGIGIDDETWLTVIFKHKDSSYTEIHMYKYDLAEKYAKSFVRSLLSPHDLIQEASVWSVNKDGSLEDKICVFYRILQD